jgi:uncharacterized protein (TIGR03437 family)
MWTTLGAPGAGLVRYTSDGTFNLSAGSVVTKFSAQDTALPYDFYQHRVDLTRLTPGTAYQYRVYLDSQPVATAGAFTTADGGPFTFLVVGDSGDGAPVENSLAQRMAAESAALLLHMGDLAYDTGTFEQYDLYYFDVYRDLMKRIPFFPVAGNHDYLTKQAAPFVSINTVPAVGVPAADQGRYYSFDWGPVHFVAIDSNLPLNNAVNGTGTMLRWLADDLKNTHQLWRIAYFHHTPFPTGHHLGDPQCELALQTIVPILEQQGVQLVLNGHEHAYERSRPRRGGQFVDSGSGTIYVTSGGGGSGMQFVQQTPDVPIAIPVPHYLRIKVDGPNLAVTTIGADGGIVDSFTISSAPYISPEGILDSASFSAKVAPGSLFSILGFNLATYESPAALPLPPALAGTNVNVNGNAIPLLFASRLQINGQMPYEVQGTAAMRIVASGGTIDALIAVADIAPAIFQVPYGASLIPAIVHLDGRLVSVDAPASRGEWLVLFGTGLGKVTPSLPAGVPASTLTLYRAVTTVHVIVSGVDAEVGFAGLAPGYAGLNQINFRVPDSASDQARVQITAGTAASQIVSIRVR